MRRWLAAGIGALCTVSAPVADASGDALAAYRWKSRVLLLFAPDDTDPRLQSQLQALAGSASGLLERDLVVLQTVAGAQPNLRERFRVAGDAFAAVLIGKDGGEKQRSAQPIQPQDLFATIDVMPMRRSEARSR